MASKRTTSRPEFWNERYRTDGYAFGAQADPFVSATLQALEDEKVIPRHARIADVGAGEGRNAVHAALRGHDVVAVDFAAEGLAKAEGLATSLGVRIRTQVVDLTTWVPRVRFDVITMTLVHLLPDARQTVLSSLADSLRPQGWLIGRWFSPTQAERGTFGPSARDRLVTPEQIKEVLRGGAFRLCASRTIVLDGGRYLQGEADVLDVVWQARRP
ncbi:MAG: class I SAM-dependent methyltransferase [Bacteroidota bacterium]